ncbi:hypothetical protein [Streptomyces zaomyceticus]|uniref:hypothetical protein n=1 Tax=Streptomyces zaomyceticus TaxID=68286 RepID=UPI002E245021
MSRLASPTAVRHNRPHFVNVGSKTVRDKRLSYRELGLLVYLLDQKEGWQVRSDQLSKGEGREGREAIRKALNKLATFGYYRTERRRLPDGTFFMGTAVSESPVAEWVTGSTVLDAQANLAVLASPTAVRVSQPFFVHVGSKTVRDKRLSYRELGLLVYLLDQKEGWQVRSDQLCQGEGREGREAIRKALNKLAAFGYYRMERRRLLNGKFFMGTAVSEYPVDQWVTDHTIFSTQSNPAVPVVEQADSSFLVEYPDGTYGSDGIEPDPDFGEEPPADLEPEEELPAPAEDAPARPEPTAAPEPERTPTVEPQHEALPREAPGPGSLWTSTECAAHHGISPQAWRKLVSGGFLPEHTGLKGSRTKVWDAAVVRAVDIDEAVAASTPYAKDAQEVAAWWWEDAKKYLGPYAGASNGFVAVRGMIEKALQVGYTRRQCADALRETRQHHPSPQQWQRALGIASNYIAPTRPGGGATYSDAATWGDPEAVPTTTSDAAPSGTDTDLEDVVFGVVPRQ